MMTLREAKTSLLAIAGAVALMLFPVMTEQAPAELARSLQPWLPLAYVGGLLLVLYAAYAFGRLRAGSRPPVADPHSTALAKAASDAGLLQAYPSRGDARADIIAAVRTATFVKILSNKGDEWLSASGLIAAPLVERATAGERVPVKTLLLHPNSPWLLGRAAEKGFWSRAREQILADFTAAHERVLAWQPTTEIEPPHFHRHDPSWRFIMTDREMFLQTYATNAQIERELVLRLSNRSPIYASACRHFDDLYELDSAEKDQMSVFESLRQKSRIHEASSGLVVTRDRGGRRAVLVLCKSGEVWLSKGGIEQGEDPVAAARRELSEETGLDVGAVNPRFVQSVLVEQPFYDAASVKVILFYHVNLGTSDGGGRPGPGSRWCDDESLTQWTPRYSYVPEVLEKVGIRPPHWKAPKYVL